MSFASRNPGVRVSCCGRMLCLVAVVTLTFAASLAAAQAPADAYPSRPIRFVIGGGPDVLARVLGQKLAETWGQQAIVDQRGGGAAAVSAEAVAKAKPDGYTVLLATSTHATHMVIPGYVGFQYDLVRDFSPVTLAASTAFILSVHPSLPVKSVPELIRFTRDRPGKLNYGSAGSGSPPHLTTELFKINAGVNVVHVPYKTIAAAVTDLIAGQLQVMFVVAPSALPHIATGRIRALAVSSAKRSTLAPDLPSVAEAGVKDFDIFTWNGVLAPPGTPPAIVSRLQGGLVAALKSPDVQDRVRKAGFEPLGTTSEELAQFLRTEIARWTKVVKQAGVRAE